MNNWLKKFTDPSAEYRLHPFWSWNDKLEEDELRRQIRLLAESGQGGFFMHARSGLRTPYMDDEWMRMIAACTDEATKTGVRAWCYDELGWPSGSAGGAIPALGEEYCSRWLRLRPYEGKAEGDVIGFYAVESDTSFRFLGTEADSVTDLREGERVMYATSFFDDAYFDILDPKVVRAFIDHTYEGYERALPGSLESGALRGFFTDEPQYAICRTPWSLIIPEEFNRSYGYSIIENIPALFLGRDGHEKVRFDFWRMVSRLFTESFGKQIFDWCDAHSTLLTGHTMLEDNLLCQIHSTAGCMPLYEYMHIPGIDWLGRGTAGDRLSDAKANPLIALQVGSVAAQLGKKQVLTETYAMSGWDISFAEMRHLVEWQFIGGVNLVCQHLNAYTLRAERKGDYPPSMFYQSAWWDEYRSFADTVARTGKLLADGEDSPESLMLHPMHSIWLKYTNSDMNAEGDFDNRFTHTVVTFAELHLPIHLGDESIISRHGSVENGLFRIGGKSYKTVFVPDMWGLDRTTYELLMQFTEAGGRVVLLGETPEFIDGVKCDDELAELFERCDRVALNEKGAGRENLVRYADSHGIERIRIDSRRGAERLVRVCKRAYPEDGKTLYFLLNSSTERGIELTLTVPEQEALRLYPDTMRTEEVKKTRLGGAVEIKLSLAPMESVMIVAGEGITAESAVPTAAIPLELGREWTISPESDKNCLLLEHVSVSTGDGWHGPMHSLKMGGYIDFGNGCDAPPEVKYTFTVDTGADLKKMTDARFVTEVTKPILVTVNGKSARLADGEWWLDHAFSVFEIGEHLRHGENEVILSGFCHRVEKDGKVRYVPNSPFSFAYLTGSFGVFAEGGFTPIGNDTLISEGEFYVSDRPMVTDGNIVTDGHPFFRGKLCLEKKINVESATVPRCVDLSGIYAACGRVSVNGERGELIAWGDMREDVTSRLREGENDVKLELYIGNRNLLGPHHMPDPTVDSPGPDDFTPSIYEHKWKKRYSFIKAGING